MGDTRIELAGAGFLEMNQTIFIYQIQAPTEATL